MTYFFFFFFLSFLVDGSRPLYYSFFNVPADLKIIVLLCSSNYSNLFGFAFCFSTFSWYLVVNISAPFSNVVSSPFLACSFSCQMLISSTLPLLFLYLLKIVKCFHGHITLVTFMLNGVLLIIFSCDILSLSVLYCFAAMDRSYL